MSKYRHIAKYKITPIVSSNIINRSFQEKGLKTKNVIYYNHDDHQNL